MTDLSSEVIVKRIHMAHSWLLKSVEGLSEEDFYRQPSPVAPPIGWHLWHTARWADRLQASLPRESDTAGRIPDAKNDIWTTEQLVDKWGLDGTRLGKLQSGTRMEHAYAAEMTVQAGMAAIVDYASSVFATLDDALDGLTAEQMHAQRISIMYDPDPNVHSPTKETTTVADLGFHFSHANRHVGSIEALRGLTGEAGSVSA